MAKSNKEISVEYLEGLQETKEILTKMYELKRSRPVVNLWQPPKPPAVNQNSDNGLHRE